MATLGVLGMLLYAGVIPAFLYMRLKKESQRTEDEDDWKPEFLQAHGWLVLRYKPSRWWFEFPLCAFKITLICTSELMGSDELALPLLIVLATATALLLKLVVEDQPYRDSQGKRHETPRAKPTAIPKHRSRVTLRLHLLSLPLPCAKLATQSGEGPH